MKKITMALIALATAAIAISGCKKENPFFTAGEDDFPRILNTDIPENEAGGGKPCALPNVKRPDNFTMEIRVTPADYTTVNWIIDGYNLFEGNTIDYPLFAGTHSVKILATTTKGKQTWRNCTLKVLAGDNDPSLASAKKSRWFNPGANMSIEGKNLEGVTAAYLLGKDIAEPTKEVIQNLPYIAMNDFENNVGSLSFNIPADLILGTYMIVVEKEHQIFGCGDVTVTDEEYKEDTTELVIWEGESDKLTWNAFYIKGGEAPNPEIDEKISALIADGTIGEGTILKAYVSADDAGAEGALTTAWWNDINTGTGWEAAGLKTSIVGDMILEYTIEVMDYINEQGIAIVGNGFHVTKFAAVVPSQDTVIWEGESEQLTWTPFNIKGGEQPNVEIENKVNELIAQGVFKEGVTLKIDVSATASADVYGAITTTWWNDINTGTQWEAAGLKTPIVGDMTLEYTVETMDYINEQGIAVVGNGFVVKRVAIK